MSYESNPNKQQKYYHISVSQIAQLVKWNGYHFQDGFEYHRVQTVPGTVWPPVGLVLEELQPGLSGQIMRSTTHEPLGVRLITSTAVCLMPLNSICEININILAS